MVDIISSIFSNFGRRRDGPQHSSSPTSQRSSETEEDGFVLLGNTSTERNTRDSDFQPDAPPTYESQTELPSFDQAIAARQTSQHHQHQSGPTSLPIPGRQCQHPISYQNYQAGSYPSSGSYPQHPPLAYQPMSGLGSHMTEQQPINSHITQSVHNQQCFHGNQSMQCSHGNQPMHSSHGNTSMQYSLGNQQMQCSHGNHDGKQTVAYSSVITADDIPFELSPETEMIANVSTLDNDWLYVPTLSQSTRYQYDFSCENSVMKETACVQGTQTNQYVSQFDRTTYTSRTLGSQSTQSWTNTQTDLMSFD